jgi:hypothetical protein
MKSITDIIEQGVIQGVQSLYGAAVADKDVSVSGTRREFEGDYTVVVFPFTRVAKKKPEEIGAELGQYLVDHIEMVERYNVIKGFLNLVVSDRYWLSFLDELHGQEHFGRLPASGRRAMVEFSSPNTNKPLHLGHIRNILLGWSTSRILEAAGLRSGAGTGDQRPRHRHLQEHAGLAEVRQWATPAIHRHEGRSLRRRLLRAVRKALPGRIPGMAAVGSRRRRCLNPAVRMVSPGKTSSRTSKTSYFNESAPRRAKPNKCCAKWEAGDPGTVACGGG